MSSGAEWTRLKVTVPSMTFEFRSLWTKQRKMRLQKFSPQKESSITFISVSNTLWLHGLLNGLCGCLGEYKRICVKIIVLILSVCIRCFYGYSHLILAKLPKYAGAIIYYIKNAYSSLLIIKESPYLVLYGQRDASNAIKILEVMESSENIK